LNKLHIIKLIKKAIPEKTMGYSYQQKLKVFRQSDGQRYGLVAGNGFQTVMARVFA